jgi:hypothetical protein
MRANAFLLAPIGCLALTIASQAVTAQPAELVGSAPAEGFTAAQALAKTFPQMGTTPETAAAFGFATAEQAKRATVQTPLRIAMIGLDRLKAAEPEASMQPLVVGTNAVRTFVVVDGKVTASVITREVDGTWQAARFGRPLLSSGLAEGLRARSAFEERPPANVFELDIPALNLWFIAQQDGTRLTLIPAADDERFGFRKGVALDSQEVMRKIVPYAKELKTGDHLVD